jgi:hypothetical protein
VLSLEIEEVAWIGAARFARLVESDEVGAVG